MGSSRKAEITESLDGRLAGGVGKHFFIKVFFEGLRVSGLRSRGLRRFSIGVWLVGIGLCWGLGFRVVCYLKTSPKEPNVNRISN